MLITANRIKELNLVRPCIEKVKCNVSYGLEPNGYTLRLNRIFYAPIKNCILLDPMNKEKSWKTFKKIETDVFILKPKSFVLAQAKEYIKLPTNITAIALTKSTYARLGIFANITTIDAGWEGYLTIEIANLGRNSVKIYADYGIAEVVFFEHAETKGYQGNYQKLQNITI